VNLDLGQAIATAEALLADLRDLHGMDLQEDVHGRAARERRSGVALTLQVLSHDAERLKLDIDGTYLAFRQRAADRPPAPDSPAPRV
jgi:hypothetical protein